MEVKLHKCLAAYREMQDDEVCGSTHLASEVLLGISHLRVHGSSLTSAPDSG